jgi:hypothetical protein
VTRNVTWPNDESTELDTTFFRVASEDGDVGKDEWKVLRKQEMHFFPPKLQNCPKFARYSCTLYFC